MHAAKARAMKAGAGSFDIDDFVSKLITFMGGRRAGGAGGGPKDRPAQGEEADADDDDDDDEEEEDEDDEPLNWERIGRKALAKSRRVPVMDFMCVAIAHLPSPWLSASLTPGSLLMFFWFLATRATGSGRWRSNRKSARWANARNSRRTRRTSGGRRSSAKKTSRGLRTRRRNM
jgi:hypothetical protein